MLLISILIAHRHSRKTCIRLQLIDLGEPSLTSYLTGGNNGPTSPTTNASTVYNYNSYQRQQHHHHQQQSLPFTTMRGSCGGIDNGRTAIAIESSKPTELISCVHERVEVDNSGDDNEIIAEQSE